MQLIPVSPEIQKIPGRVSEATAELIFLASSIPPMGFKSYYIQRESGDQLSRAVPVRNEYNDVSITHSWNKSEYY